MIAEKRRCIGRRNTGTGTWSYCWRASWRRLRESTRRRRAKIDGNERQSNQCIHSIKRYMYVKEVVLNLSYHSLLLTYDCPTHRPSMSRLDYIAGRSNQCDL